MKQLLTIYCFLMLSVPHLLSQNGLKADYFDGQEFNRYVATEYVENIDFYWNKTPPVPGINPHKCSVRYTGNLKAPKTGVVNFTARVDVQKDLEGVVLYFILKIKNTIPKTGESLLLLNKNTF